jgi:hypothetical protein
MGRKFSIAIATIATLSLLGGGAFAGTRYLITSTHQIKPSVLKQFQGRLGRFYSAGKLASMCASGTDTTGQCEIGNSDARCPGQTDVTGGGIDGGNDPPVNATAGYNEPDSDGRGWHVIMANNASVAATYKAVAVCLGTVGHLARDANSHAPASVKDQIAREAQVLRSKAR